MLRRIDFGLDILAIGGIHRGKNQDAICLPFPATATLALPLMDAGLIRIIES
jgi:hypothetical protein